MVATLTCGGPSPDPDHLYTSARLVDAAAGQPPRLLQLLHPAAVKLAFGSSPMAGRSVATLILGGPSPDPDHLCTSARLADAAG